MQIKNRIKYTVVNKIGYDINGKPITKVTNFDKGRELNSYTYYIRPQYVSMLKNELDQNGIPLSHARFWGIVKKYDILRKEPFKEGVKKLLLPKENKEKSVQLSLF